MMRILIAEDEARLARLIAHALGEEGYVAETVRDGRTALARALAEPFDLLVIDRVPPGLEGVQIVRKLRAAQVKVPVLMLSAGSDLEDRVEALDEGADDCLPKPFAFAELLARVRALTRWPREEDKKAHDSVLEAGDVTLDPGHHVVWRGGERVELSAREFALLAALLRRPGQVFTRSILLDTVWGDSEDINRNVVDVYISYLRKKLDRDGEPSRIRTVWGVGYTFDPHRPGR